MRALIAASALLVLPTAGRPLAQSSTPLPPSASRAYDVLKNRLDGGRAMDVVIESIDL